MALPLGVKPMIRVQSILQEKCSRHSCERGCNRDTDFPLTGSSACTLTCLCELHPSQASARLSSAVSPPTCHGMICSTEKDCSANVIWLRQYSQHPRARLAVALFKLAGTRCLGMAWAPYSERSHESGHGNAAQLRQFHKGFGSCCFFVLQPIGQAQKFVVLWRCERIPPTF